MTDPIHRDLLRGSLELMVLSILAEEPKYGYLIQKKIRQSSDDQVKLPAGTMYPLLHRLEDDGLINSGWDDSTGRKRKWYQLTTKVENDWWIAQPNGADTPSVSPTC